MTAVDYPGVNTELQPLHTPLWMRPLVDSVADGSLHHRLRGRAEGDSGNIRRGKLPCG